MDEKLRQEALLKLVDNNVSAANMEVWIDGYIAGRKMTITLVKDTELEPLEDYERE